MTSKAFYGLSQALPPTAYLLALSGTRVHIILSPLAMLVFFHFLGFLMLPPTSGPLYMLFSTWNTHSTLQTHLAPLVL